MPAQAWVNARVREMAARRSDLRYIDIVPPMLQPDGRLMVEPRMNADEVGRAVVYMANLPLDTNVLFMTVMANMMQFVGRG